MPHDDQILFEAEFNPRVRTYWLLSGCLVMVAMLITIPLIPLWLLLGHLITDQLLKRMKCTLTNRSLKFEKGLFIRIEKTIPLDKITDLGLVQGPVMRYFQIESLSIETAGSTTPHGASLSLTGIRDGRAFRDRVLAQRDRLAGADNRSAQAPTPSATSTVAPVTPVADTRHAVLLEIRDSLHRIESALEHQRR